jgi:hypothetical protein
MSANIISDNDSDEPSWTGKIVKGVPFQRIFRIQDQPTGAPVQFSNLQIDVVPDAGTQFSWTQENGKLTRQDDGGYLLSLSGEDTAAFGWSSAAYFFNGTELLSGDKSPRFLTGVLLAEG